MEIHINQGVRTVLYEEKGERERGRERGREGEGGERSTLYLPPEVSAKFYWLWPSFPQLPGRPGLIGVVIGLQRILGSHTHTHTHTHIVN